jgi:hypothetical protein
VGVEESQFGKASGLFGAVLADRLIVAALPDANELIAKGLTEVLAASVAVLLVLVLQQRVFARPRIQLAWQIVSSPVEVEGPALQLPGASSYFRLTATMHRNVLIARWVLKNLDEVTFETHVEPAGALEFVVENTAPPGYVTTRHSSVIVSRLRCAHGGSRTPRWYSLTPQRLLVCKR